MAKDNLFLGTARGSVGDVTFSRLNGVQVARVRNRSPRNPQSPAQMVQRIIMSTVGKAYSFMSAICNHSFEGFEQSQLSQRKFMEINVGLLRDKVAEVLAYPVEEVVKSSNAFNFSFKNDFAPVLNRYVVSDGSLPSINLLQTETGYDATIPLELESLTPQTVTYADMVRMLGVQRGDQLTFVQVAHDGSISGHDTDILTGFRFARIILDPASGDMTTPFIGNVGVNDPNPRNEGSFRALSIVTTEGASGLSFRLQGIASPFSAVDQDKRLCASAVILSRQNGNRWQRSKAILMPNVSTGAGALNSSTMGLAYDTYKIAAASDLYLNQAD